MSDHHHMEHHNTEDHVNHLNNGMDQMVNSRPHEHFMTDNILNAATDMNDFQHNIPRSHDVQRTHAGGHGGDHAGHTGHSMSMTLIFQSLDKSYPTVTNVNLYGKCQNLPWDKASKALKNQALTKFFFGWKRKLFAIHFATKCNATGYIIFHGGCIETILFSWWNTDDVAAFIGSFIAIFIMALLYEGLKYYRKHLLWKTYTGIQYCAVAPPDKNVTNICATDEPQQVIQPIPHVLERSVPTMLSTAHGFQTCLHGIQVLVSYMLMLVFMTYNTWLCAAVVLGSATGYFLFGWRESVVVDFTEHCH